MPAPSKVFTVMPDSQVDADSPGDEVFTTGLRDNDIHLEEWLGKDYVAAQNHDHDGVNSKALTLTGQVAQGDFKSAAQEVLVSQTGAGTNSVYRALTGGKYGFDPVFGGYVPNSGSSQDVTFQAKNNRQTFWDDNVSARDDRFINQIWLSVESVGGSGRTFTTYAEQTYIQASPPYKIGDKKWGEFVYILRNINTKEIVSTSIAPDPIWAYNGPEHNKKDSPERIEAIPHPFVEYYDGMDGNGNIITKDPSADGLEIILLDTTEVLFGSLKKDAMKNKKPIGIHLQEHINHNGNLKDFSGFGLGNIHGFTDKLKILKG